MGRSGKKPGTAVAWADAVVMSRKRWEHGFSLKVRAKISTDALNVVGERGREKEREKGGNLGLVSVTT